MALTFFNCSGKRNEVYEDSQSVSFVFENISGPPAPDESTESALISGSVSRFVLKMVMNKQLRPGVIWLGKYLIYAGLNEAMAATMRSYLPISNLFTGL